MSELAAHVSMMTNEELIGLAKNRFLDSETQVAIAKGHYRRAKEYLTFNSGLSQAARDILWNHKGYVFKCNMIKTGHYNDEMGMIEKCYDENRARLGNNKHRLTGTFLRKSYWYDRGREAPVVSESFVRKIYDNHFTRQELSGHGYSAYDQRHLANAILEHPNCPVSIAVELSTVEDRLIGQKALKKMADLG